MFRQSGETDRCIGESGYASLIKREEKDASRRGAYMTTATLSSENKGVLMEYSIQANAANTVGCMKNGVNPIARIVGALACIVLAIAVSVCMMPSNAYAASTKTASKTNYVAGCSTGHLWAKDTIQYKYSNGKIVSKPTVNQQASAICKVQTGVRGPVYGCYYKYKAPTIKYSKNAKTATVTTYWVCKQGVSIKGIGIDWHKTCTVTYTCNGNGKITVSKKAGKLQLG